MPKQRNNQNQTISRTPSSYFSSVISNRDDRFNPSVSGRRNDYLLFYFFLFFLFFFFSSLQRRLLPHRAFLLRITEHVCIFRPKFSSDGENPFSAFSLPFGNYYRDSGFTQISSFSVSRFLFRSGGRKLRRESVG